MTGQTSASSAFQLGENLLPGRPTSVSGGKMAIRPGPLLHHTGCSQFARFSGLITRKLGPSWKTDPRADFPRNRLFLYLQRAVFSGRRKSWLDFLD